MKAITILQPWASLIACGAKKIETRGWPTKYRGKIAIHAGKKNLIKELNFVTGAEIQNALPFVPEDAPTGAVIAIAELVDCIKVIGFDKFLNLPVLENDFTRKVITITANELLFGDLSIGRYAWLLENVQPIEPVPARGMQRLWEWEGTACHK